MRRILVFLLALIMSFSMGCSKTEKSYKHEKAKPGKIYKIATDTAVPPLEYVDAQGELVGLDMDLLKEIANDQGFKYEIQYVGFSKAMKSLDSGKSDAAISGLFITKDRKEKYDFSDPYYDSGISMAVAVDSYITGYKDLKGKKVAARRSTEALNYAESLADEYGFTIVEFDDTVKMFQDVVEGNSQACFEDYPIINYEIIRGKELKIPLEDKKEFSYGMAVQKTKNPELVRLFNKGLANLKSSGRYDEIVNTYIVEQ